MKLRKIITAILTLSMTITLIPSLGGCSLAVKGAENDSQDILIGVFITDDTLDFSPNPLYAKINRHNSSDVSDWEADFKDVKGISFFAPIWTDKDGFSYHHTSYSDEICDSKTEFLVSDQGNESNLSAAIYMAPPASPKTVAYHVNRVYQTPDGKIYAVPGSGVSTDTEHGEGEMMSVSADDQIKYLEGRELKTDKTSVTVRFLAMYKPVKISLFQMNEEHQVIKQEDFTPGNLPSKLTTEKGTSYILVETVKQTPDGGRTYARNLYECGGNSEDSPLETFYAMDTGIMAKQYTEIVYQNK